MPETKMNKRQIKKSRRQRELRKAYAAGLLRAAKVMEADRGQKETHPSHAGITFCLEQYPKAFRELAREATQCGKRKRKR